MIRKAVGENVLLDKDGSPMLNLVGLVDAAVSRRTRPLFRVRGTEAPGIAARFYMHRNLFLSDPDAFNVCRKVPAQRRRPGTPEPVGITLQDAQVAIMLSAISGGMYEIGDDLPVLGTEKDRLALVGNGDLLAVAKLSQPSLRSTCSPTKRKTWSRASSSTGKTRGNPCWRSTTGRTSRVRAR